MSDTSGFDSTTAFHYRNFRLFWSGQAISMIGTWMQITASSWLLYDLTNSPFQLGLNGIFRFIPTITIGLMSGTIADRYDRKRLLLVTQTLLMLIAFLFGFLVQTGLIRVWHVYALTFLNAVIGSLDGPLRQAILPALVPRQALPNAIAWNSTQWKSTVLLGPSLAGIAISTVGTDGAFYANAASFLAVLPVVFFMKISSSGGARGGRFLKDIGEGFSYVFSQKTILAVLTMEATAAIFGIDQAMLTIFSRDILQVGAHGLGFLQSARGLGAIIGSAVLLSLLQSRSQGKILFVSALLYGASFALFGLSYSFPLSLTLLFIVGATDTTWGAARNTILQIKTPEGMRGRVMGVLHLSSRGLSPLGQAETGFVVPLVGAREATFLGGLVVAVMTLATAWSVPSLPRFKWGEEGRSKVSEVRGPEEA